MLDGIMSVQIDTFSKSIESKYQLGTSKNAEYDNYLLKYYYIYFFICFMPIDS